MTETVDKKVILFNGPPGVGKDTAALAVCGYVSTHAQWMRPRHLKIAEPLKKATHAAYDVFHTWEYYGSLNGSKEKDVPCAEFLGLSPRQAYIGMSDAMKAQHGDEVFGFIMRKRILKAQGSQLIVISDCGFAEELDPIVRLVGQRNVLLVELHAVDRTFAGDSRGYVAAALQEKYPKLTVRRIQNYFGNEEEKQIFRILCQGAAKSFLQIEEG